MVHITSTFQVPGQQVPEKRHHSSLHLSYTVKMNLKVHTTLNKHPLDAMVHTHKYISRYRDNKYLKNVTTHYSFLYSNSKIPPRLKVSTGSDNSYRFEHKLRKQNTYLCMGITVELYRRPNDFVKNLTPTNSSNPISD